MKKIVLLLALCLLLTACGQTVSPAFPEGIPLDENGFYAGFDDLPESYTLEQALADGCHAVVNPQETMSDISVDYGQERVWNFLYDCFTGTPAYLRTVYFLGDNIYYRDLYCTGTAYYYFESELGDQTPGAFSLVRLLESQDGSPRRPSSLYVFTDSTALTYDKIMRGLLSSTFPTEPYIPFIWLESGIESSSWFTPDQFTAIQPGVTTYQEVQELVSGGHIIVDQTGIREEFPVGSGAYVVVHYTPGGNLVVEDVEYPVSVYSKDAYVVMPHSKDGVEELLDITGTITGDNLLSGVTVDFVDLYNVTTTAVAEQTGIGIFKSASSCMTLALIDGEVYELCESFGGYGFHNAVPCDFDGDGNLDLLVAASWGSGYHRTEISVFNTQTKESTVLTAMGCDLMVADHGGGEYGVYAVDLTCVSGGLLLQSATVQNQVGTIIPQNGEAIFIPSET